MSAVCAMHIIEAITLPMFNDIESRWQFYPLCRTAAIERATLPSRWEELASLVSKNSAFIHASGIVVVPVAVVEFVYPVSGCPRVR